MFNVIHRGAVSTTMDAAREPDVHLGVFDSLLAESQTNGRGQYRRNWGSPAGNLYASLRLPMEPPFVGTEAAVACGAAVCAALEGYGYPAVMKWPNDVALMFGGTPRKVCGILTKLTSDAESGTINGAVIGIGVNVTQQPQDFPEELRDKAISVREAGAAVPRAAIAAGVRVCGENRVQELVAHLAADAYAGAEQVHFIGHLQTNKVKQVVGKAALIQSVGSLPLLEAVLSLLRTMLEG